MRLLTLSVQPPLIAPFIPQSGSWPMLSQHSPLTGRRCCRCFLFPGSDSGHVRCVNSHLSRTGIRKLIRSGVQNLSEVKLMKSYSSLVNPLVFFMWDFSLTKGLFDSQTMLFQPSDYFGVLRPPVFHLGVFVFS